MILLSNVARSYEVIRLEKSWNDMVVEMQKMLLKDNDDLVRF